MKKTLHNVHPGEMLLEEFLKPMDISQNALARAIDVPPPAHQRNCSWQACDLGRYGTASCAGIGNLRTILDGTSGAL